MKTLIRWLVYTVITRTHRISEWWDRVRTWRARRREARIQAFVNRVVDQAKINLDWSLAEAACREQKEKQLNYGVTPISSKTSHRAA
jgi:hypothetical protein